MIETTDRPSTASLFSDALAKTSHLFGSQLQLVRIEMAEKIGTAIKAVVGIVAAAVFLIVAMIFLLQGLVAVLVERGWAASIANGAVGAAIAVVALITIAVAARSLSPARLTPDRSLRQIHEDADLVKGGSR